MAEQGTWPIIYNVFMEAFKLQVEMGHPEEAVLMEMYLSKEPGGHDGKGSRSGILPSASLSLSYQPVWTTDRIPKSGHDRDPGIS